jgi:hypothetical protein
LLKILEKLLSRKVNADMLFLSELLTYKGESQILLVNYFDQVTLDYSLHSLTFIDEYLLLIRQYFIETKLKKLNEEEHQHFIQDIVTISLRIGAYVGETIRENDQKQQWYWIKSNKKRKLNPILLKVTQSDPKHSSAILTNGTLYEFPMNIVIDLITLPHKEKNTLSHYVDEVLNLTSHSI